MNHSTHLCRLRSVLSIASVGETCVWVSYQGTCPATVHITVTPLPCCDDNTGHRPSNHQSDEKISFRCHLLPLVSRGPTLLTALLRPNQEYHLHVRPCLDDDSGTLCEEHAMSLLVHTCPSVELHRLRSITEHSCSLSWVRPPRSAASPAMIAMIKEQTSSEHEGRLFPLSPHICITGDDTLEEVELTIFEHGTQPSRITGRPVAVPARKTVLATLRLPADPNFVSVENTLKTLTAYSVKIRSISTMKSSLPPNESEGASHVMFGRYPHLTPFFVTLPPQECTAVPLGPTSLAIRRFRESSSEFTELMLAPSLCLQQLHPPAFLKTEDRQERLRIVATWEKNEHIRAKVLEDMETIRDFVDVNRAQRSLMKLRSRSQMHSVDASSEMEAGVDDEAAAAIRRRRSEVDVIMVFQERRKTLIQKRLSQDLYRALVSLPSGWTEHIVNHMTPGSRYEVELEQCVSGDVWEVTKNFEIVLPAALEASAEFIGAENERTSGSPQVDPLVISGTMTLVNLKCFLSIRFTEFVTVEHVSESSCTLSWAPVDLEAIASSIFRFKTEGSLLPAELVRAQHMLQAADEISRRRIALDYCIILREVEVDDSLANPALVGAVSRLKLTDESNESDEPSTPHVGDSTHLEGVTGDPTSSDANLSSERCGKLLAAIFLRGSAPAPSSLRPRCPPGWQMDLFRTHRFDVTRCKLRPGKTYAFQMALYNAIDRLWCDLSPPVLFTTLRVPQPVVQKAVLAEASGWTLSVAVDRLDPIVETELALPSPHLRPRHACSIYKDGVVDVSLQRLRGGVSQAGATVALKVPVLELAAGGCAHFRGLEANTVYRVAARTSVPEWKRAIVPVANVPPAGRNGPQAKVFKPEQALPGTSSPLANCASLRPIFVSCVCVPVGLGEATPQRTVSVSSAIPRHVVSPNALSVHTCGQINLSSAHSRKTVPFPPPIDDDMFAPWTVSANAHGYDRLSAQVVVVQSFAEESMALQALENAWRQEAANVSFAVDWVLLPNTITSASFEFVLSAASLALDVDLSTGVGIKECATLMARHATKNSGDRLMPTQLGSGKGNLHGLTVLVELQEEWQGGGAQLLKFHGGINDLVLDGLAPGSKYSARVRPVLEENSVTGDVYGLWSRRVTFVTAQRLFLTVAGADETSIAVKWHRDDFQKAPSLQDLRAHGQQDPQRMSFGSSPMDIYCYLYRHSLFGRYRLAWNEADVGGGGTGKDAGRGSIESPLLSDYVVKDLRPATLMVFRVQQKLVTSAAQGGADAVDRSARSRSSATGSDGTSAGNSGTTSLLMSRANDGGEFLSDATWCMQAVCVRTLAELCPVVTPLGFNEFRLQLLRQTFDDSPIDGTVDEEMLPIALHVPSAPAIVQAQIRVLPAISGGRSLALGGLQDEATRGASCGSRAGPIPMPSDFEDPWPHLGDAVVPGDAYWRRNADGRARSWFMPGSSNAIPVHEDVVDLSVIRPCAAPGGLGEYALVNLAPSKALEYTIVGVKPGAASYVQLRYRSQDQPRPSLWSIHATMVTYFPPAVDVESVGDTSMSLLLSSPPTPRFHPSEGSSAPEEIQLEVIGFFRSDSWDPANNEFEAMDNHGRMFRIERRLRRMDPMSPAPTILAFDSLRSGSCYLLTASAVYGSLHGTSSKSLCVATVPPAKCTVRHASDVYAIVRASREDPQYEADVRRITAFAERLVNARSRTDAAARIGAGPSSPLLARVRNLRLFGVSCVTVVPPVVSDKSFELRAVAVRGRDEVECTNAVPHPDSSSDGDVFLIDLQPGSVYKCFARPAAVPGTAAGATDWSSPAVFATKLPVALRMEFSTDTTAVFVCHVPSGAVPQWAAADAQRVWEAGMPEQRAVCLHGDEDAGPPHVATLTLLPHDSTRRVLVTSMAVGCVYSARSRPVLPLGLPSQWVDIGALATRPYPPSLPRLYEWLFPNVSIHWSYDKNTCNEESELVGRAAAPSTAHWLHPSSTGRAAGEGDDVQSNSEDEADLRAFASRSCIASILPLCREPTRSPRRYSATGTTVSQPTGADGADSSIATIIAGRSHRSMSYDTGAVRFEVEAALHPHDQPYREETLDRLPFVAVGTVPRPFARMSWELDDEPPRDPERDVFFRVRAVVQAPHVGDIRSVWTRPVSFRPLPRLAVPAGLCVEGQLGECVVFRWNAPPGVELHNQVVYDVELARAGPCPQHTPVARRPSSSPRQRWPVAPPGQHWRVSATVAEPRAVIQNLILREQYRVRVACRSTYSRSVSSVVSFTVFPRSQPTRVEMANAGPPLLAAAADQVSFLDAAKYPFPLPLSRDAHPPSAPSVFHVEYKRSAHDTSAPDLPISLPLPSSIKPAKQRPGAPGEVRHPSRPSSAIATKGRHKANGFL